MSNFLLHIGNVSKLSRYDRLNLTPCNIEITSKYRTKETQTGLPIILYLSQIREQMCLETHFQYVTFHEQECVYDFPSLSLAARASADVSELTFMYLSSLDM